MHLFCIYKFYTDLSNVMMYEILIYLFLFNDEQHIFTWIKKSKAQVM